MWSVCIHTNTHTTECTKAAKATTPSARCHPRLEGVSVWPLSHLCDSGSQASVTPRRKWPRTHTGDTPSTWAQPSSLLHLHSTESHVFIQLLWSFRRNHNGNKKEKKQPPSTFIVHSTMTTSVWLVFPNNNKDSSLGVRMCGKTLKVAWLNKGNVSIPVQQLHWCTLSALLDPI